MALVEEKIDRSLEQNRMPRDRLTYMSPTDLRQRSKSSSEEKGLSFQPRKLEQLDLTGEIMNLDTDLPPE